MAEVEPWLVREWGAPVWETVARAPLAASQSYEAREHFRTLTFEIGDVSGETGRAATVEVMFSDVNDAHGVARLVGWEAVLNGVEEVTAPEGLTIRMPPAGLDERVPAFEITLGGVNGWTHDFDIVDGPPEAVGIRGHVAGTDRVRLGAGIRRRDHREIPAVPATPHGPIISDLVLRPDGLGPVDFGGSAGEFVDELVDRFGPPAWEMNAWARPGDTLRFRVPLGYFPETELRYLTWYDPGLTISLADGPVYGGSEPGDLRLVNWSTSSNRLRLGTGVGVGSPLSAVVDAHPDLTIGSTAYCSGAYLPAGFSVGTDAVALDGGVEWDWISELQAALNARGAALAVDGEYGPRTASAVGEFQRDAAIGSTDVWDSDGVIGPLTLEALGLAPPATAPVTGLRAGNRGTC